MANQFFQFLVSLAHSYLIYPELQTFMQAAGIDWSALPPKLDPVAIVLKYQALRNQTGNHELALHECMRDVDFLERLGASATEVPTTTSALGAKFNMLYRESEYFRLGQNIVLSPDKAQDLIDDFKFKTTKSVEGFDAYKFVLESHEEFLEEVKRNEAQILIPGFEILSRAIGGFNPGRLIMFLAETGYGKTQANINLALQAATKMRVGYVNQEMLLKDLSRRIVAIATQNYFSSLYAGEVQTSEVEAALRPIRGNLDFTAGHELSVSQIRSWLITEHKKRPYELVIIDYDQRLSLKHERHTPEWQLMKEAVQDLETLAKELKFCCILVAQLNREGDISSSHRAQYAAHTVLHFKKTTDGGSVIFARKNRHGKKNAGVSVSYSESTGKIVELEEIIYDDVVAIRKLKSL